MNADAKTSQCSAGSKKRKALGYLPGSAIASSSTASSKRSKARRPAAPFPGLPTEVLDKILEYMVASRSACSVIKLSMVNRQFRQEISDNLRIWHQLYLHWRGPVVRPPKTFHTPRGGLVSIRPTLPTTVPNFRIKTPPIT
jgi:hypothetical protein